MLMEARRRTTSFSPSCCSALLSIQLLRCLFSHLYHHSHTFWPLFAEWCILAQIVTQGLALYSPLAGAKILPSLCLSFLIFGKPFELRGWKGSQFVVIVVSTLKNTPINHLSGIVKQVSLAPEPSDWTEKNFLLWHFPLVLITLNSCFRSCLH